VSRSSLALAALVILACGAYHSALASLWTLWTSKPTYDHGLLVLGICAFMVYRNWIDPKPARVQRAAPAVALLVLLCSSIWALGYITQTATLQQLGFLVLLGLLPAAIFGMRAARALAMPIALLVFTLPVWDPLVAPLQSANTLAVTAILNLTGVPAVAEGSDISVPSGTFTVWPACVGLAQIIVAGTIAIVFSHLGRLRARQAVGVVAGAVATAVVANLLRIYATVLVGQMNGMDDVLITQHWAIGWLFFALGMMMYFFAIRRVGSEAVPALSIANIPAPSASLSGGTGRMVLTAALCGTALMVGPLIASFLQRESVVEQQLSFELPRNAGTWQARPFHGTDGFRPEFMGTDARRDQTYVRDDAKVDLHVARYAYQTEERKAIALSGAYQILGAWHALESKARDLDDGTHVVETEVRSTSGARKLVWHWYYVHKRVVANVYWAKLVSAWGVLRGDRAVVVFVVVADLTDPLHIARARADMHAFVSDARPAIEAHLDRAGS
jgi:EpsI family protein